MRITLPLLSGLLLSGLLLAQSGAGPFAGRWNFTLESPGGSRAMWLGVMEKNGATEVWFQPTGGNVYQVKEFRLEGGRLTIPLGNRSSLELTAAEGRLNGTYTRGQQSTAVTGLAAPKLDRPAPRGWTKPEPIFNGKDLTGWEPMGDPSKSHWAVRDGKLVNEAMGANLKTTRKFDDFQLRFEVKCPNESNSGFYLRGRYEIQLEYHPGSTAPPERRMASIYGRIAPARELPATPGEWEKFEVTLVGRTLTVVRNGVTIIDRKEVEGITGGAIDANEAEPGPFYIQGDHTGGLEFRNITVAMPRR
jgi:hypothetical protein